MMVVVVVIRCYNLRERLRRLEPGRRGPARVLRLLITHTWVRRGNFLNRICPACKMEVAISLLAVRLLQISVVLLFKLRGLYSILIM